MSLTAQMYNKRQYSVDCTVLLCYALRDIISCWLWCSALESG